MKKRKLRRAAWPALLAQALRRRLTPATNNLISLLTTYVLLRGVTMNIPQYVKFKNPVRYLKRRLTGCCLLITLVILLLCGSLVGILVFLARPAEAQSPGSTPLEVMLLIDNSNSMFEKDGRGSDPELLRIQAAHLFITYLGVDSGGVIHRLGVIFFGGEAELVMPLTPLTDDQRRAELAQLIADPQRMSWTNPSRALELALDTLSQAEPLSPTTEKSAPAGAKATKAVILLTDGKPEWGTAPTDAERTEAISRLRAMADELAAEGIPLFIILLQNKVTDADPEIEQLYVPLWQEMAATTPPGRFYEARQSEALLDIYHDIVVTLTGRQTAGVVVQTEVQTETIEQVSVEPGLAQITLVVRKSDPALSVEISLPSGQPLDPAAPGVQHGGRPGQSLEEIWAIADPPVGIWQIRLNGRGAVTVWKDFYPATPTPTPRPSPTATPTLSPTPTATPIPSPTATSTPTATLSPTSTQTPTATTAPTVSIPRLTSPATAAIEPVVNSLPPTSTPNLRWWLAAPVLILVMGGVGAGSWLWYQYQHNRPLLSGALRRVAAPGLAEAAVPARLDLDSLERREIRLGPDPSAFLYLPSASHQPTPAARLVAHLGPDDHMGVNLVPEPGGTSAEPVQVNSTPLSYEWPLRDGDIIALGAYRFKYENLQQRTNKPYGR